MKFKIALFISISLLGCGQSHNNNNTDRTELTSDQNTIPMAKRIKIDGLQEALTNLQNGQTEFEFIGITSNGIDCLYFIYEKGKFNFEYEAMVSDQIPFIDKLNDFAKSNNFESIMTTYGNDAQYKSDKLAPVIRIMTNFTINDAVKLGETIQTEIFKNNNQTVYDIVP